MLSILLGSVTESVLDVSEYGDYWYKEYGCASATINKTEEERKLISKVRVLNHQLVQPNMFLFCLPSSVARRTKTAW